MTRQLTLLVVGLLFWTVSSGQTLSPKVLTEIQQTSEFAAITSLLEEKGFKKSTEQSSNAFETIEKWYFQPFVYSGETVSSSLTKTVDSSLKAKTVFSLYNPFHYKEFIKNLTDAKYKFRGTKYVNGNIYYVFRKKGYTFTTTEKTANDKTKSYQITLQTD